MIQNEFSFSPFILEKFVTCIDFEKFKIFKKTSIFPKTPNFWTFWEFFLFQSHSTANLLQFGEKITSCSDVNKIADVGVNAIGKHRVKNCQIVHLRGRFCFHFVVYLAKNNNWFCVKRFKSYLPLSLSHCSPGLSCLELWLWLEVRWFSLNSYWSNSKLRSSGLICHFGAVAQGIGAEGLSP